MRFPTKETRPGEIPEYTKSGLGRVPETRLDQYNLPQPRFNAGEAWKEVVGTGTKLYQQYSKMQSEAYHTEMSPKLAEMVLQAHNEAAQKFNPANTKENYSQQVAGYMDNYIEKNFFSSSEFIKENETEVNSTLRKEYQNMRVQFLQSDFETMANARRKEALDNVTQAATFAGTSSNIMLYREINSTKNILGADVVSEDKKEKWVKVDQVDEKGRARGQQLVPVKQGILLDAIVRDEQARHQINKRNFDAGVISYSDFLELEKDNVRLARKQAYQTVLDAADAHVQEGNYDKAIELYTQLEQAVPFIETRIIYDSKAPGGAVVTGFWGEKISDQQYQDWDDRLEKNGAADGIIAKTNRASILTPDEQHEYINAARQKAAAARAAKSAALRKNAGGNYVSKAQMESKLHENRNTSIHKTYGVGADEKEINERNQLLRGI